MFEREFSNSCVPFVEKPSIKRGLKRNLINPTLVAKHSVTEASDLTYGMVPVSLRVFFAQVTMFWSLAGWLAPQIRTEEIRWSRLRQTYLWSGRWDLMCVKSDAKMRSGWAPWRPPSRRVDHDDGIKLFLLRSHRTKKNHWRMCRLKMWWIYPFLRGFLLL